METKKLVTLVGVGMGITAGAVVASSMAMGAVATIATVGIGAGVGGFSANAVHGMVIKTDRTLDILTKAGLKEQIPEGIKAKAENAYDTALGVRVKVPEEDHDETIMKLSMAFSAFINESIDMGFSINEASDALVPVTIIAGSKKTTISPYAVAAQRMALSTQIA